MDNSWRANIEVSMETRQSDMARPIKKYKPYGDNFVVDRRYPKKKIEDHVGLEGLTVSQELNIVDDQDKEWIDDRSKPEIEFDDKQQQSYKQELRILRVLEWLINLTTEPKESSLTIQNMILRLTCA